jgi:hypothetical protein
MSAAGWARKRPPLIVSARRRLSLALEELRAALAEGDDEGVRSSIALTRAAMAQLEGPSCRRPQRVALDGPEGGRE